MDHPEHSLSEPQGDGRSEFSTTRIYAAKAAAGDPQAFAVLYQRHFDHVLRSVAWRVRRTCKQLQLEVEEVVHDGFVEAFESMQKGKYAARETSGSFRNWVVQVIVHNLTDEQRRKLALKRGAGRVRAISDLVGSTMGESGLGLMASSSAPSEIARRHELLERLDMAVQQLSDKHRKALDLRYNCGMEHAEIAEELGYNKEVTVRAVVFRAKEQLRKIMGIEQTDA